MGLNLRDTNTGEHCSSNGGSGYAMESCCGKKKERKMRRRSTVMNGC